MSPPRIAVWFPAGLEHALAARAALGRVRAEQPNANWVLLGPASSAFLFEMDTRVPAYIALNSLEGRRHTQSRLAFYLAQRAQLKQLRSLQLSTLVGVAAQGVPAGGSVKPAKSSFSGFARQLGVHGQWLELPLTDFFNEPRPVLEAGPQALAFATRLHRESPPSRPKRLVLLVGLPGHAGVEAQWRALQAQLQVDDFQSQRSGWHTTVAVVLGNDARLQARQLKQQHPDWLQISLPQAMGLIAYADRVMCDSEQITHICAEMGRSSQLLLVKSYS